MPNERHWFKVIDGPHGGQNVECDAEWSEYAMEFRPAGPELRMAEYEPVALLAKLKELEYAHEHTADDPRDDFRGLR